jgi:macrolide-specific efflux system membrane fusion protein
VTSANRVLLRPQMTANVKIITEDHKDVLKVPATAIQRKPGAGPYVIVMNGENREDRPVTLGLTDNDSYEIVSGVKEGETVELKKSDLASAWAGAARGGGGFRGPR